VVAAVSAGGALGALARHGVELALPARPGGVPWSTLLVNASGCLLVGVVLAVVVEGRTAHRLARPFLVTGVLGGYTTFSTCAVDAHLLLLDGRVGTALAYLAGTAVLALAAVRAGLGLGRRARARQEGGS
jgi:CrcB protein